MTLKSYANIIKKFFLKINFFSKSIKIRPSKFPGMPKKLILIVGCYNSGTTLLHNVLGKHTEISSFADEGVSLTDQFLIPETYGWHRLWYKCRKKIEIIKNSKKPNIKKVKNDWAKYHDRRKKFALEKSIVHSLNVDWFESNFSKPYFIWIIRNGYVVSEGIRRRTLSKKRAQFEINEPYPIEWCAKQWVESNTVLQKKLSNVKNSFFLRYEDLTQNPKLEIKRLLNWLPVKKKNIKIQNKFKFHNKTSKMNNKNNESFIKLSALDKMKIKKIAFKTLKQFNYN